MVAVRTIGCCPIVKACDAGHRKVEIPWSDICTNVQGVRVTKALGSYLIWNVMDESDGFGAAVMDDDVESTRRAVAEADGTLLSLEGAEYVAYRVALSDGRIKATDRTVAANTAMTCLPQTGPANQGKFSFSGVECRTRRDHEALEVH